jgi:hypothetical protein
MWGEDMLDFLGFVVFNLFSQIFHYVLKVLKFTCFMSSFQIYANDCCVLFKHESHVHDFYV